MKKLKNLYQEIKLFSGIKRLFNLPKNTEKYILADRCDSLSFWHFCTAFSAAIVAKALNAQILYLEEMRPLHEPKSYLIFNKSLFGKTVNLKKICEKNEQKIQEATLTIFNSLRNPEDILTIKYNGLHIGEQIYDDVLALQQATIREINLKVKKSIERAVRTVIGINELIKKYKIVGACCTHTKCAFDGVWIRVLLQKNIHVFQGLGGLGAVAKLSHKNINGDFQLKIHLRPPEALVNYVFRKKIREAEKFLEKRLTGNSFDWDAKEAFNNKKAFFNSKQEFCKKYNLSQNKKNIFVMLHALSDGPHVKGIKIFRDFYHWFIFTLARSKEFKKSNWIFKSHPRRKNYPDDCNLYNEISYFKFPNVRYISSEDLNSACIHNIADFVITAAGSAGLEFQALGIPTLICCKNGYHGFSCCHEAFSLRKYEWFLKKINTNGKLPKINPRKSLAVFYLMHEVLKKKFSNGIFEIQGNNEAINMEPKEAMCRLRLMLKNEKELNTIKTKIGFLQKAIQKTLKNKKHVLIYEKELFKYETLEVN